MPCRADTDTPPIPPNLMVVRRGSPAHTGLLNPSTFLSDLASASSRSEPHTPSGVIRGWLPRAMCCSVQQGSWGSATSEASMAQAPDSNLRS